MRKQQVRLPTALLLAFRVCVASSSVAEDRAQEAGTTRDIIPCAVAHYSFGTAVTTNGLVLFTEFNHRQIRSWNPQTRRLEVWRAAKTPGLFGLATGTAGDVFVGMDLGDKGNPGKVLRIRTDGQEEFIVENITRPRQLTCDRAGNLYAVLEGGKVLKWDKAARTVTKVMTALSPVSGIVVGADGSVYVSEYGVFEVAPEGYSRPSIPGQVKVKRSNGEVVTLAQGFWRTRGLALHDRILYLCSESNREDHGNAGQLVRIDTMTGAQEILLDRLDYPQFPAVSSTGTVYFTLARDNRLVAHDPAAPFRSSSSTSKHVKRSSVRGGSVTWGKAPSGTPFTIRAQSILLSGSLQPDPGATHMDGWIEIPADRFKLDPNDLYPHHDAEHPSPGIFELPPVKSTCGAGELHVEVFPLRRHQGSRWPMQHVGTANESPAPGFSEAPEAFRFYFSYTAAPAKPAQ